MTIYYGIIAFTLVMYIPIASIFMYIWHTYGKGDKNVMLVRFIFLIGSIFLLGLMISI
jgi:hypothetical protein